MKPKISIITPSFNQGEYIEKTITSILDQQYFNLEYIIIDGGSTDNTVDIIKKYEKYIDYWVSEDDEGQSHAINKGIGKATGDVFNWVNSDDYLAPNSLELIGERFGDDVLDVFCTPTQLFNSNGNIRENPFTDVNKSLFDLLNSVGLNQLGMYWRLDKIKQLNGVNTGFNYSMDLDLWKRFLLTFGKDNTAFDETVTGYFRLCEDSKTGSDLEVNFDSFEKENNAALRHYAACAGQNYLKGVEFLFPNVDKDLASLKPASELPPTVIKNWLTSLFYSEARKAFYEESFKKSYKLSSLIDAQYMDVNELKNLSSYKRWSFIKRFL